MKIKVLSLLSDDPLMDEFIFELLQMATGVEIPEEDGVPSVQIRVSSLSFLYTVELVASLQMKVYAMMKSVKICDFVKQTHPNFLSKSVIL